MKTTEMKKELGALNSLLDWIDSHPLTWNFVVILGSIVCILAVIFYDITTR